MEASKRKKIETQLRKLLDAADQDQPPIEQPAKRHMGNIQVIRKRKGQPDRCIVNNQPCSD